MARIHGMAGQVKIDPTGGATTVAVASVDSWDLDLSKDLVDVTCFLDTNKQSVMGLANYAGNLSGVWDSTTTPTQIFDVIFGVVAPMLELVPSSNEPTFLFSGLAYLDGALKVSAKGAVTWSGKFAAAGPWSMQTS
jgi:hypothetical protein